MRILATVLALLICFSFIALADPESHITGPYNVSFDMGLMPGAYTVSVDKPIDSETINGIPKTDYQINIRNNDGLAWANILITKYNDPYPQPQVTPPEDLLRGIMQSNYPGKNVEAAARVIDGANGAAGFISSGQSMRFNAAYIATFDQTLVVYIQSIYPWDSGTLQLLKTIHIEKINATQ